MAAEGNRAEVTVQLLHGHCSLLVGVAARPMIVQCRFNLMSRTTVAPPPAAAPTPSAPQSTGATRGPFGPARNETSRDAERLFAVSGPGPALRWTGRAAECAYGAEVEAAARQRHRPAGVSPLALGLRGVHSTARAFSTVLEAVFVHRVIERAAHSAALAVAANRGRGQESEGGKHGSAPTTDPAPTGWPTPAACGPVGPWLCCGYPGRPRSRCRPRHPVGAPVRSPRCGRGSTLAGRGARGDGRARRSRRYSDAGQRCVTPTARPPRDVPVPPPSLSACQPERLVHALVLRIQGWLGR